jgi:hypothetical protein
MESLEVIFPIQEPTDWVSSLVIAEKSNGDMRLCLDPKHLNKAIKRQHYPIRTAEEIFGRMKNPRIFSKLDCTSVVGIGKSKLMKKVVNYCVLTHRLVDIVLKDCRLGYT